MAAEDTIHTRTFQVTVSFTDEQRDKFLDHVGVTSVLHSATSLAICSEIMANLESLGLDAGVTIVERREVG